MDSDRAALAQAVVVLDALGAGRAWRRGLRGEPLGIACPVSLPFAVEVVVWGSAVSAPAAMDVVLGALVPAWCRGDPAATWMVRGLGWLRLVGTLSEPLTWRRRPWPDVGVSAAHLLLASLLIRRSRSRPGA